MLSRMFFFSLKKILCDWNRIGKYEKLDNNKYLTLVFELWQFTKKKMSCQSELFDGSPEKGQQTAIYGL